MTSSSPADVIIIGAGFSGLTAALKLADSGLRVTVLEASDRVGGRTASGSTTDGQWLELGGQWVATDHHRLRALIERFGLRTESTARAGLATHLRGGDSAPLDATELASVRDAARAFSEIIDSVDMVSPWLTPNAELLDEGTFASWIRQNLPTDRARRHFVTSVEAIFAPDPVDVSLLHAAYYFRSGNHVEGLLGLDREAQEERVVGGASVVCDAIAAHLGDRVLVGQPVRSIQYRADEVTVTTRAGREYSAGRAILTLPAPLAGRLEYSPPMPTPRERLTQLAHAISVVKLYLVYERPFWRDSGLSGEGVIDDGPIRVVLDNTPAGYDHGVLVAFIEKADSTRVGLLDADSRRAAFVSVAIRLFGPSAGAPLEYLERDWSTKEFASGCYSGHFAPGTWTGYGPAVTTPVGPLHWAGTETATEWTGYMEGAVQSGLRVAGEVLDSLSRSTE